jgi:hypothetical protein
MKPRFLIRFLVAFLTLETGICAGVAVALEEGLKVRLYGRADSGALWLSFREGPLSLEAKQESWVKLLQELSRITGIVLHIKFPPEGPVTASFKDLPIEQALKYLFGPDASFMFLYHDTFFRHTPSPVPSEAWVFARGDAELSKTFGLPDRKGEQLSQEGAEGDDRVGRLKALDAFAESGNKEALEKALVDMDRTIQERALELLAELGFDGIPALVEMTKSDDPVTRLQSLSVLYESGQADDRTVLSALDAALAGHDMSMKSYAIQVVADKGGSDAMAYLRQAFGDPNPSVRMMVMESVIRQGQDLSLVEDALSDPDERVRALAALLLKQKVSGRG